MSVTTFPHLEKQLAEAVTLARSGLHQPDCRCSVYRRDKEGWCTPQEWRGHKLIDTILGQIERLNF